MRKFAIMLAPAFAAIATVPAVAQTDREPVSITVSASDLVLTDAADRARLEARVESAINRVCRAHAFDSDARRAEAACRSDLRAAAAERVEVAIAEAHEVRFATLDLNPGA